MKQTVVIMAMLLTSAHAMGQRVHEISGSLDALKGVKKLNVKYAYDDMEVGKKSEKEFVAEKKSAYNDKEPGKGDKWEKMWVGDRQARFEPRFEEEFNKSCEIQTGFFPKEKYTLIFKTVYTEPGFNVGVMRRNAYIDGEVWIVETASPDKPLAKLSIENCPGRTFFGMDYDTGERIQEAYAMAGKGLGRYFARHIE